jgi:hypothetical protein
VDANLLVSESGANVVLLSPPSVVNLELDLLCLYRPYTVNESDPEMCLSIGKTVPQLKCLRLGLSFLCSGFLEPHQNEHSLAESYRSRLTPNGDLAGSRLEVIVITLYDDWPQQTYIHVKDCDRTRDILGPSNATPTYDFTPICDTLRSLIHSGDFPNMQSFKIVTQQPHDIEVQDLLAAE